jgi:hypothetical protein
LLYGGTERGMFISFDDGAHWQRFQQNLPATPIMDLKIYRNELIVATEGRAFWVLDGLPIVRQLRPGLETEAGILYKPTDAYRQGGPQPSFYYWLKDQPSAPVSVEVRDAAGAVVFTATGQPGAGAIQPPPHVPPAAGRGGRGRGAPATTGETGEAAPSGEAGQAAGRQGGRGRGGAAAAVGAHQGLNHAAWDARFPMPFAIPPRIVMWGGGRGGGPKVVPGSYTVKVSSGTWSQSQTFRVDSDPRLPRMTDADAAEQLKMAQEVGGQIKRLYETLAQIRDAKKQAADLAQKTSALAAASKALTEKLVAVEGDMTQLQGEASQDALNFPGRLDNQMVALYSNIVAPERKLGSPVHERYADLRPKYDEVMSRAAAALKNDIAAFNAEAANAGVTPGIVLKTGGS